MKNSYWFALAVLLWLIPTSTSHAFTRNPQTKIEGKVERFLLSGSGEVEGVLLTDNTALYFPPSMGEELAYKVKPGSRISAQPLDGIMDLEVTGKSVMISSIAASGNFINLVEGPSQSGDSRSYVQAAEERGYCQTDMPGISGLIVKFVADARGELNRVILSTDEQIKLKPLQAVRLLQRYRRDPDGVLVVSGLGSKGPFGVVVEASAIRFDDYPLNRN